MHRKLISKYNFNYKYCACWLWCTQAERSSMQILSGYQ